MNKRHITTLLASLILTGCQLTERDTSFNCLSDQSYQSISDNDYIAECGTDWYANQRESEIHTLSQDFHFKTQFDRLYLTQNDQVSFLFDEDSALIASQTSVTSNKALFQSGKSTIKNKQAATSLEQFLAHYIANLDTNSIVYVVGHTDSDGPEKLNQKLSKKRAIFIAKELEKAGLEKQRIFIEGVGESQPLTKNRTRTEKAQNRRFELIDVMKHDTTTQAVALDDVLSVSFAKKKSINTKLLPTGNKNSTANLNKTRPHPLSHF
ncbi:OmpA family protein [Vibrio sp.]|nr:OmpA family protein [Vibrio sp.]